MTNFNERTNTLLYKNIPLTLYPRKGWCFLCVRDELETGTNFYIDRKFFFDHSNTSFSSWLGCSTVGNWGPQALSLQADSHAGILSPTDSSRPGHLVILLFNIHLLPLFFRLFTQGHLLTDGSVEGQYITIQTTVVSSFYLLFQY